MICRSGTIFGRDVVPDVCSTSATSSASAAPGCAAAPASTASGLKVKCPAGPDGINSITGIPRASATARAGVSMPCCTTSAFAFRSDR